VKLGCVACHVGRAEAEGGNVRRLAVAEQAIGCESCHGPGARHVELRRAGGRPAGADDLTVVHPGKLPRPRLEAVCAVCHQSGVTTTYVRGRRAGDFRPGRPLSDYRLDYRFASGGETMTVVGHVEQLRRSACYQKSDLTCLTCHDPHAEERPKDPVAFYRQKCLDCHAEQACRLTPAERRRKVARDNCAACHMPRGDTDIPHVAFTHHRIGRHAAKPAAGPPPLADLVPIDDISHLGPVDQARNLGLAYLQLSIDPRYTEHAAAYGRRALGLLEGVDREGLRDGATAEGLARLYWAAGDTLRAGAFARQALDAPGPPEDGRALSLFVLADCAIRERDIGAAVGRLEELTRLRRFVEDWHLLGVCYLEQNQPGKALRALEQALAMRPFRPDIHEALAAAYLRSGDRQRAREHQDKAKWLEEHSQQ
jgi:tetratricopeptide (TPR) repeat protein